MYPWPCVWSRIWRFSSCAPAPDHVECPDNDPAETEHQPIWHVRLTFDLDTRNAAARRRRGDRSRLLPASSRAARYHRARDLPVRRRGTRALDPGEVTALRIPGGRAISHRARERRRQCGVRAGRLRRGGRRHRRPEALGTPVGCPGGDDPGERHLQGGHRARRLRQARRRGGWMAIPGSPEHRLRPRLGRRVASAARRRTCVGRRPAFRLADHAVPPRLRLLTHCDCRGPPERDQRHFGAPLGLRAFGPHEARLSRVARCCTGGEPWPRKQTHGAATAFERRIETSVGS